MSLLLRHYIPFLLHDPQSQVVSISHKSMHSLPAPRRATKFLEPTDGEVKAGPRIPHPLRPNSACVRFVLFANRDRRHRPSSSSIRYQAMVDAAGISKNLPSGLDPSCSSHFLIIHFRSHVVLTFRSRRCICSNKHQHP